MNHHILTKSIGTIPWIFTRQRIHRKEPSDPWVVHTILVIHRISFAFNFIIGFLTLEPITVIPSTSVPTRHLHTIWIIITITHHISKEVIDISIAIIYWKFSI